ncbi:DarT1-associated NADAR antitoxin family protein [Chromatium okenii]|jgi:hypothetical protein|uniref:Uncharacterized protein n=1 Tax=Chromatium okenii TaxID=61644 RepID=A0A2S7XTH9_9GAMM|nr:hypothetical protein [Chromatium okenii]MBV5310656.1 hypothetical protein [Chromatium okenii]PQJ97010.1 hypothetical protein CXB77_03110 [Chromatium okenii]
MATRPVFIPRTDNARLVDEISVDFQWSPGFAPVQKKKNIRALHEAAYHLGYENLLEVSTKSEEKIGVHLSAFNLRVLVPEIGDIPLENAYQGSKVFLRGGPFNDLYKTNPREAKKDPRLKGSGPLSSFRFDGELWTLEPKTAFYDWLYIRSIYPHREYLERLCHFGGFTDIEFNPSKSLNCQARSCAIFVSLMKKGILSEAVENRETFISILRPDSFAQPHSQSLRQGTLL